MNSFLLYHIAFKAVANFVKSFDLFEIDLSFQSVFPSLLLILGLGPGMQLDVLDFIPIVDILYASRCTVR